MMQAMDQQMLTFLKSRATQLESTVLKETLAETQYPELVRIFAEMNPNADRLETFVGMPGNARMVPLSNGGMDFPTTANQMRMISTSASSYVCAYSWTQEEINKSRYLGYDLPKDRIEAAHEVAEREKDRFVLHGDETQKWRGLFTNTDKQCLYVKAGDANTEFGVETDTEVPINVFGETVKPYSLKVGSWVTEDSDVAYQTISRAFALVREYSRNTLMPDTLLVSGDLQDYLMQPYRVSGTGLMNESIMSYLMKNNPYTYANNGRPFNIRVVFDLPKGHAVLYNSDIRTLRFIVARDLEFIGPQVWGYEYRWFGQMKVGGIQILKPKNICYISGLNARPAVPTP